MKEYTIKELIEYSEQQDKNELNKVNKQKYLYYMGLLFLTTTLTNITTNQLQIASIPLLLSLIGDKLGKDNNEKLAKVELAEYLIKENITDENIFSKSSTKKDKEKKLNEKIINLKLHHLQHFTNTLVIGTLATATSYTMVGALSTKNEIANFVWSYLLFQQITQESFTKSTTSIEEINKLIK